MKTMLARKDIRLVPKLTEAILEVWVNNLTSEYLKKLSDSIRAG
jgi:hypothetical protein